MADFVSVRKEESQILKAGILGMLGVVLLGFGMWTTEGVSTSTVKVVMFC